MSLEEFTKSAGSLVFFTRESHDGSICPFDAKKVRVTGLPAGMTAEQVDLAAYPGDSIQFGENGVGILGADYKDLKAGTLVVTGSYRGNPVFNTILLYSSRQTVDEETGEVKEEESVPLAGTVYLFAALPQEGDMGDIDNGLWVFVPNQQTDNEFTSGEEGCTSSLLSTRVMAELHRTDAPEGGGKRITAATRWIPSPTYDTMPKIILEE